MVSSTLAPVACSRYALSGSDSRSILSAAVVGIMLIRRVLGPRSPPPSEPDFEHAAAPASVTIRARVADRQEREGVRTVATEYHAPAHPGNAGLRSLLAQERHQRVERAGPGKLGGRRVR